MPNARAPANCTEYPAPSGAGDHRRERFEGNALSQIELSIIAPAHNEEDNVEALVRETAAVIERLSPMSVEMIVVDDGSTDSTFSRLVELAHEFAWLRVLKLTRTPPGRGNGQSAAFKAAFEAARGRLIAPLDADLQNPPDNIPAMLERLNRESADMVQGDRSQARKENDGLVRVFATWVGRTFRHLVLGDTIRDTGCSLRIMKREIAAQLPLEFRGMHRFIPGTARRMGYKVVEMPVTHRAREAGKSKYGPLTRGIPGFFDTLAVRWMHRRRRPHQFEERTPARTVTECASDSATSGANAPASGHASRDEGQVFAER